MPGRLHEFLDDLGWADAALRHDARSDGISPENGLRKGVGVHPRGNGEDPHTRPMCPLHQEVSVLHVCRSLRDGIRGL